MAKPKKTDVAVKKADQLPAEFMDELAAAGEQHRESMTKDDMSIPFLSILQSLSPQCTKGEPEYIKAAEASDLYNSVTQKTFTTTDEDGEALISAVQVLPIYYKRSMIEWIPRNKGGGLVKEYSLEDGMSIITQRSEETGHEMIQQGSPLGTPGNQLVDTHTHFMFAIYRDGTWEPIIIACTRTQLKPSKDLNNMVSKHVLSDGRKAPRYFGIYSVTTQRKSNDKGSWYIWKFEKVTDVLEAGKLDMFREAKAFYEGVDAGEHKADHAKMADGDANPTTSKAPASNKDGDDGEVPF